MAKWRLPKFLNDLSEWVAPPEPVVDPSLDGQDEPEDGIPWGERPTERSVLWLPGGWGEHGTTKPHRYELFVEQDVLREVGDHALEEIEGSYGLLAGRLLACRETRIPYVHIEQTYRSYKLLPADEDLTGFREFFWGVREEASRSDRVVVGWYHTHSLLGLQLSERDRQLHVAHFQDEWPVALVVVTREGAVEGGFFQRDRGDILFRRSTRPFSEVTTQRVRPGGGPYVSAVAWQNYWTHEPVLYARRPGDTAAGGKWFWRRGRAEERDDGPLGLGASALLGSESRPSGTAADGAEPSGVGSAGSSDGALRRARADVRFTEPAMGRPKKRDDALDQPSRGISARPLPVTEWADWKKDLEARREQEKEQRARTERESAKAEAERIEAERIEAERAEAARAEAAEKAEARAKAQSDARREARAAAEAAALAAADALGIQVGGEALEAEGAAALEPAVDARGSDASAPTEVYEIAARTEAGDADVVIADQTELGFEQQQLDEAIAEPPKVAWEDTEGTAADAVAPIEEAAEEKRPADVALEELGQRALSVGEPDTEAGRLAEDPVAELADEEVELEEAAAVEFEAEAAEVVADQVEAEAIDERAVEEPKAEEAAPEELTDEEPADVATKPELSQAFVEEHVQAGVAEVIEEDVEEPKADLRADEPAPEELAEVEVEEVSVEPEGDPAIGEVELEGAQPTDELEAEHPVEEIAVAEEEAALAEAELEAELVEVDVEQEWEEELAEVQEEPGAELELEAAVEEASETQRTEVVEDEPEVEVVLSETVEEPVREEPEAELSVEAVEPEAADAIDALEAELAVDKAEPDVAEAGVEKELEEELAEEVVDEEPEPERAEVAEWLDEEADAGDQVPDWEPAIKAESRESEVVWDSLDFADDSSAGELPSDVAKESTVSTEMPLFVLPEPLPLHARLPLRLPARLRRFAPWIGIGLVLAAAGAWFLLT